MNLSAMVIIIAISWAGTPIFSNGLRSDSIPSVSFIGVVVKVKSDEPTMRSIILRHIFMAKNTPSRVTVNRHIVRSGVSPSVTSRLMTAVKIIIRTSDLRPLIINLKGTLDIFIVTASEAITTA